MVPDSVVRDTPVISIENLLFLKSVLSGKCRKANPALQVRGPI